MSFSPILGPKIAPFAPAMSDPPRRTWPFFRWALRGAWWGVAWAAFWSVLAGSLEAISATFLGKISRWRLRGQTPRICCGILAC